MKEMMMRKLYIELPLNVAKVFVRAVHLLDHAELSLPFVGLDRLMEDTINGRLDEEAVSRYALSLQSDGIISMKLIGRARLQCSTPHITLVISGAEKGCGIAVSRWEEPELLVEAFRHIEPSLTHPEAHPVWVDLWNREPLGKIPFPLALGWVQSN